jgi:hypothetical protein
MSAVDSARSRRMSLVAFSAIRLLAEHLALAYPPPARQYAYNLGRSRDVVDEVDALASPDNALRKILRRLARTGIKN